MRDNRKVKGQTRKMIEKPRKTYYLATREIVYLVTRVYSYPRCKPHVEYDTIRRSPTMR